MAHFCVANEEEAEVGGGIWMRDMLRAFSLFPWFAFLSLLIPWQTLMRLQLPGSANSTSIIHPVQLHPLNTHTLTHAHACSVSPSNTHTYNLSILLSTMPWLLAVAVIKAVHYLFMADPKYELKPSRREVTPEAFSKGWCIIWEQTDCLVWKEGDKCCLGLRVLLQSALVFTLRLHIHGGFLRSPWVHIKQSVNWCKSHAARQHQRFISFNSGLIYAPVDCFLKVIQQTDNVSKKSLYQKYHANVLLCYVRIKINNMENTVKVETNAYRVGAPCKFNVISAYEDLTCPSTY